MFRDTMYIDVPPPIHQKGYIGFHDASFTSVPSTWPLPLRSSLAFPGTQVARFHTAVRLLQGTRANRANRAASPLTAPRSTHTGRHRPDASGQARQEFIDQYKAAAGCGPWLQRWVTD